MKSKNFIRNIPLFESIPDDGIDMLLGAMRKRTLKKGEALFRKGDEGSTLYIIRSGSIKIVLPSPLGDEMAPAILTTGDFFGEMALLDGMPRSADAVALEETELLALNQKDFLAFLRNNEEAIQATLSYLTMRLRRTDNLLEDTCFLTIAARLAKRLVELADTHGREKEDVIVIDLKLTQSDLASMVGSTRESINKELAVLRKMGLVDIVDNMIHVLNMPRLARRARL